MVRRSPVVGRARNAHSVKSAAIFLAQPDQGEKRPMEGTDTALLRSRKMMRIGIKVGHSSGKPWRREIASGSDSIGQYMPGGRVARVVDAVNDPSAFFRIAKKAC